MQFIEYYYCEKENFEFYDLKEKLQNIQTKFENIYFQTYYPLSTVKHLPNNNKIIVSAENDILMFDNYVNNFFEYTVKQI
ncbi:hypothetical protein F8M41_002854 [Gigaspora margarita]|uniref:Uncharacterized protein n=1 Tax=Gigaspora margarita TaxID=4874 RepID=A0A8H3XC83_GIGMA|nr:hypothetical protein F8M41_002854 [Gigaspora margarita]